MSDGAVVVITSGPRSGERFDAVGELVIGRDEATITLDDDKVSRHHAVIREAETGLAIEDVGSTNGTWLNGRRLEARAATPIRPGDEIRVGTTTLTVAAATHETVVASAEGAAATPLETPVAADQARPASAAPATPFSAGGGETRRGIATRDIRVEVVTIAIVIATAVALVVYFGLR